MCFATTGDIMNKSSFYTCISILLICSFAFALDPNGAMLFVQGVALVNDDSVIHSAAVFPGDTIETKSHSQARLGAPGWNVSFLSDTFVTLARKTIILDHGNLLASALPTLEIRVGDATVRPSGQKKAEFAVRAVNGTTRIVVTKGSVVVSDGSGKPPVTLAEGEAVDRAMDTSAPSDRAGGAAPAANPPLIGTIGVIGGLATTGALTGWVLSQQSKPTSPSKP